MRGLAPAQLAQLLWTETLASLLAVLVSRSDFWNLRLRCRWKLSSCMHHDWASYQCHPWHLTTAVATHLTSPELLRAYPFCVSGTSWRALSPPSQQFCSFLSKACLQWP